MSEKIAESQANSISLPGDKLGPPGVLTVLHVVPVFKDQASDDQARLQDTTLRKFKILCRLAKDIELQSNIEFNFSKDAGDSLFAIPAHVVQMNVRTHDGQFVFFPNSEKRLSSVEFECTARTSAEARQRFQEIVGPALDHQSYVTNTPLHIAQVTIVDELHQITSTELMRPHPIVAMNPGNAKVSAILAPVYAMYREAKNASSPFYKFFCYYKILEGLLKQLPTKLHAEAKRKNIVLPPLHARVPKHSDMPIEQEPYIGKSIKRFFEEYLTSKYRNSMAHFISDEGAVLNVTEMEGIQKYHSLIYTMELCCREVISHSEQCIVALEKT